MNIVTLITQIVKLMKYVLQDVLKMKSEMDSVTQVAIMKNANSTERIAKLAQLIVLYLKLMMEFAMTLAITRLVTLMEMTAFQQ